jgi:TnpA family transposase
MPVDFLTDDQQNNYGRFVYEPDEAELAGYFHLDDTDIALIEKRRGDANRFGFAIQLTTVRFLGTFLPDPTQVPASVRHFVAHQLKTSDTSCLSGYMNRKVTRYSHINNIQNQYGYFDFNNPPWRFKLSRILYTRAWISNERPSLMFDFSAAWLIQHKVLLPGITTLTRLIARIRERATNRLWKKLSSLPSKEQKEKLKSLLDVPEGKRYSTFDEFRKGPVHASGPEFKKTIYRHLALAEFGTQSLKFTAIPPVRLKSLARHSQIISAYNVSRMPENKKIAVLLAFVKISTVSFLDDALDILDLLITDIAGSAKKIGQKKRLRTIKDLDRSAIILAKVANLLLDEETEDALLREQVFSHISKEQLADSIKVIANLTRPADDSFHQEMVEQYGRVKTMLPVLLMHIQFKAAPAGASTQEAINSLTNLVHSRKTILDDAPVNIISKPWRRHVFDKENRVNKKGYSLCFLEKLQDGLRRRDIFVPQSERWGDPREKLLDGVQWQFNRMQVCRSLGHSVKPDDAINTLTDQLDLTFKRVAANFSENDAVSIDNSGKRPTLTITNLDKIYEPDSLSSLRKQVGGLLPKVDLTELLLEIHAHTGFADEFVHVSESNARADNLSVSICAVLLSEACNIGIEPLTRHHIPALTRHRLSWVKQNYLRAETLVKANTRLVDHQSTLALAKQWGGGEVASADGMRFVTPVRTLNARPNRKYFGANTGITWYNFLSDQFSGFHGIVVPGTLRDSIFVLEGLLEQQTGLRPTEIMTDTTGTSDMVFGLFWLLGYQFSPRLADAGEAKFWRIDKEADYGVLDDLTRNCVKPQRIEQHWDDMLRIAGSLKLGTVQASELIRSLLRSERPSSLAKAIIDLGRINKTLYLLNYIDNKEYRRRILIQLNRGESRHSVARVICHGQRGEIRKRYREGQEDQLGALGLVTNAVILWNTMYMQASLDHISQLDQTVNVEDIFRLSPLQYEHINVLGHYSFILAEQVRRGQLRPLRLDQVSKGGVVFS